tara:strand:- start:16800 stop:17018 length:219 start_codon:yes stop_codon:yes gene_type:complete
MKDFTHITQTEFYELFIDTERYSWRQTAPDMDWREAHMDFVWDNDTMETVGFKRTSSWGEKDEYFIQEKLAY